MGGSLDARRPQRRARTCRLRSRGIKGGKSQTHPELGALHARADTLFPGDLCEAETHLLRSVELYDGENSGAFRQNPRIDSLAVAGSSAWLLGRSTIAVDRVSQAWQEAHDLKLPFDIAFVGPWICSVLTWCGEFQGVLETAEEVLRISTEHHFPQFVALAQMYKGSALCALGNSGEASPWCGKDWMAISRLGGASPCRNS